MIKSPRFIHASNPTRPYKNHFNVKGLYDNNVTISDAVLVALTDDQIEDFIATADDSRERVNIHAELSGDDYADVMMKELGF